MHYYSLLDPRKQMFFDPAKIYQSCFPPPPFPLGNADLQIEFVHVRNEADRYLWLRLKQRQRFPKDVPIVLPESNISPIMGDHADSANGVEVIQHDIL